MQNFVKQWFDLNQRTFVATQKFANINSDLMLNLAQQQMDMVGIYVDGGSKQVQALSKAKQLSDVYAAQSQLTEEFNKRFFNNLRVSMEMLTDTKKQLTDWFQDGLKQAVDLNPLKAKAVA
jgi:coproporphyrinogen III oxidase-like Fe-S oxidoreductase